MSKPIFYEGQAVGCLMFGEGVVKSIDYNETYPVIVDFQEREEVYTIYGLFHTYAVRPTLYPIDQYREIIANLPAPQPEPWKPKPGEWCWFWHLESEKFAVVDKFQRMNGDDYMNTNNFCYRYCAPFVGELPDHLKEVQP